MLSRLQASLFNELRIDPEREASLRQLHKELAEAGVAVKSFTGFLQNKLKQRRISDRISRFGPYIGN